MIKLFKKYKMIFIPILLICVICIFVLLKNNQLSTANEDLNIGWDNYIEVISDIEDDNLKEEIEVQTIESVPIYICGEINRPGVYYVLENSLIDDVIRLAGGFTDEANRENINLAKKISSNEKIYIFKQGEKIDKTIDSYENVEYDNTLVNINTATLSQLDTLPGIGSTRAQQIIDYRMSSGNFLNIEDIKKVSGIGEKIFESLKDLITVE